MILDKEIGYERLTALERYKLKSGDFNTELSRMVIVGQGDTYVLLETEKHKFIRIKDKMK